MNQIPKMRLNQKPTKNNKLKNGTEEEKRKIKSF
jgi:hypothetical protein